MSEKRFALVWWTKAGEHCSAWFDEEPKNFEINNFQGKVLLMDRLGMNAYYGFKGRGGGPRFVKEYKNGKG